MSNTRLVRPSNLRVRAPRLPLGLEVSSKTIGTTLTYNFATEDVSRSGMLLVWEHDVRMPFIVNTLLEIVIDPKSACLERPVACLGKVVRRDGVDGTSHAARLGIQIVQIDNSDLDAWEVCVTELERHFGVELSNKVAQASAS